MYNNEKLRTVVTSSKVNVDIDMLSCVVAYQELLTSLQEVESIGVLVGEYNVTVPKIFRQTPMQKEYTSNADDKFVMVDCSEVKTFPEFVDVEKVTGVFDHFMGHRDFWVEKLGTHAVIEKVAACATLIWEEYRKAGLQSKISSTSADLLYTAIFSHSLNFQTSMTSDRDIQAGKELKRYISLQDSFVEEYFSEVSDAIVADFDTQFESDFVNREVPGIGSAAMAQLEVWDGTVIIKNYLPNIFRLLEVKGLRFGFMNIPSIKDRRSYIVALNEYSKEILANSLSIHFTDLVGLTDKLIQRKDIIMAISK